MLLHFFAYKNKITNNFTKLIPRRFSSVIGLDMGGTNTCIAIIEPNGPRVIENAEGLRTSPSYFSISEDGTEFTAVAAKRIAVQNLSSSYYGTKFFFGRKFSDEFTQNIIKRFPYKIEKGPDDEIIFQNDKNIIFTYKSVSILYLKYVREQAEALIGKPVKKVVMSIPGFINESGREELKLTVKESGMDVVKFIEEPKAAAYAYGLDKNEKINKILVFNFGGLNFSLSLLEKNKIEGADKDRKLESNENENDTMTDPFIIKNEYFDYFLGGEDIDQILIQYLLNEFQRVNKMEISNDLFALQRIREAAEKSKIELSLSQQAEISLAFLAADHTGPKHLNTRISRAKFETLIDPIITKLKQTCDKFLALNSVDKNTIDEIILVGGISRVPRVQEIIKQIFGKEANKTINPEEAPSMGASILASFVKLKIEELKQMDSLPLSIGIETLGGNFTRLIPKDIILPAKVTKTFATVYDNQPKIDLKFYMGEREIANENKFLGSFSINVPLASKGDCKVKVTFNLNNKGDLNILAEEELSKKKSNYSTKFNTDLTQEYIEDAMELSNKLKDADKAKKNLIDLKVEADNFLYNLEKLLKENNERIETEIEEEEKERIYADIKNLNEQLKGEEFEKIINIYQLLQKDLEKFENILNKQN